MAITLHKLGNNLQKLGKLSWKYKIEVTKKLGLDKRTSKIPQYIVSNLT